MKKYLLIFTYVPTFKEVDYKNRTNIEDYMLMDHRPNAIEMMGILSDYDENIFCHIFKVVQNSDSNICFTPINDFITTFGGLISNI